eukprot:CAMPEP_0171413712 /NCGR_PEP_ID=MMETSP0880-20121228/35648_1 /TAXON_ID=67004 /ORGANISM="Thalassiosira weissflogii, Strain CCMP1336" /LENGTH=96 /DNA_ID=CAMNT_0011931435 /DNA_START=37 /DNA_END=327 /DNA_ORIENTATION=-
MAFSYPSILGKTRSLAIPTAAKRLAPTRLANLSVAMRRCSPKCSFPEMIFSFVLSSTKSASANRSPSHSPIVSAFLKPRSNDIIGTPMYKASQPKV